MTDVTDERTWSNTELSEVPEALESKWYSWGLIRAGDCTMFEGARWTLYSNGDAHFDATVTSGDDHDSWIIRRVALKDGNGAIMAFLTHYGPWSADHNMQFWKDLPDSSQRYRWFDVGYFPRDLFRRIRSVQLQGCSC